MASNSESGPIESAIKLVAWRRRPLLQCRNRLDDFFRSRSPHGWIRKERNALDSLGERLLLQSLIYLIPVEEEDASETLFPAQCSPKYR